MLKASAKKLCKNVIRTGQTECDEIGKFKSGEGVFFSFIGIKRMH